MRLRLSLDANGPQVERGLDGVDKARMHGGHPEPELSFEIPKTGHNVPSEHCQQALSFVNRPIPCTGR